MLGSKQCTKTPFVADYMDSLICDTRYHCEGRSCSSEVQDRYWACWHYPVCSTIFALHFSLTVTSFRTLFNSKGLEFDDVSSMRYANSS